MVRHASAVLVFFMLIYSGCATSSKDHRATLPVSYGPVALDEEIGSRVLEVFDDSPRLMRFGQFSIPELRMIARKTRMSCVTVSRCDLKVLRVFLLKGWIPMVVLGPPAPRGVRQLEAVVGFDDLTQQVTTVNIRNHEWKKIRYSRFFRLWGGPQRACLLVFSRHIGKDSIRRVLLDYQTL